MRANLALYEQVFFLFLLKTDFTVINQVISLYFSSGAQGFLFPGLKALLRLRDLKKKQQKNSVRKSQPIERTYR